MDIYEFTQALWRRKWLLLIGFGLLMLIVVRMAYDFSTGEMRSIPKFEATVNMAVVPADSDSLLLNVGPDNFAAQASIFSTLLSSVEAPYEIEQQQGVPVLGLAVYSTGRDRFFQVTATSDSPEGAVAAAMGSFHWLEQRLAQPFLVTTTPTVAEEAPGLLDADGRFRGEVVVTLDHALAADSEGLWMVVTTELDESFAFRLSDAEVEASSVFTSLLAPGRPVNVAIEDSVGNPVAEATLEVPVLPEIDAAAFRLAMRVERGVIRGSAGNPQLDTERVQVAWEPVGAGVDSATAEASSEVGVLLLTEQPIAASIGGRRTPLMVIAVLAAGLLGLLVLAVAVDSWSQERRRRVEAAAYVTVPTVIPQVSDPIPLTDDEPAPRRWRVSR
jgi:hypothetical protein